MDLFNKAYAQLADLLKSMTPGGRLTVALLIAVGLVSGAYLLNRQVGGAEVYLMGGETFSSGELGEMEAAFGKANLSTYQVESGCIKVPRGQQSAYMAALADSGAMPPQFGDFLKKLASSNSLIPPNRMQQEALSRSTRNHELQLTINKMRGIEKCAVQIDEKVERGKSLYEERILTASVSVQTVGNRPLDEMQVTTIRGLVTASVAGMKSEAVTVVDLNNGRLFAGGESRPGGVIGNYADHKKRHELEWQQKISHVLSYIPGVLVTTNVELDPDVVNEQKSTQFEPDKAVIVKTREVPAGAPELGPGGILQPGKLLSTASGRGEGRSYEQEKKVPTTEKFIVREGRTPTRVTVSVAVPGSYYEKLWRQYYAAGGTQPLRPDPVQLATLQEAERKKIEAAVMTLLPVPTGGTIGVYPPVTVTPFYQLAEPALPDATPTEYAMTLLEQHGSTLGMVLLGLIGLVVVRGMVNALASAAPARASLPAEQPAIATLDQSAEDEPAADAAWGRPVRRTPHSATLRDELADMVRDDPDAAVGILRSWIGNAS